MKNFSDFGIVPSRDSFIGDKIKMLKILNQDIIVHAFKAVPSKFENSNSALVMHLQIELKNDKYILFTGSKILLDMIKQVPAECFPFKTKIIKEGESFVFN